MSESRGFCVGDTVHVWWGFSKTEGVPDTARVVGIDSSTWGVTVTLKFLDGSFSNFAVGDRRLLHATPLSRTDAAKPARTSPEEVSGCS